MVRPSPPHSYPAGAPPCPEMSLPPQSVMDAAPEDGIISVAARLPLFEGSIHPVRPHPFTQQYMPRGATFRFKAELTKQPRPSGDICGWVLAAPYPDQLDNLPFAGGFLQDALGSDVQASFQCVSGWTLMLWRSQEDFEAGIHGYRRAPRAMAWFDLRSAFDVIVESGDPRSHVAPYRITIRMKTGNYYFCLEVAEDVPMWCEAIRRVIQDYSWQQVLARDTPLRTSRRWPAACGIAEAICVRNAPIGERAMAILFHAYDIDFDCALRVGELMLLIQELLAATMCLDGHAEHADRALAVASASLRLPEDDLFDRAMLFRNHLCPERDGKVRKDEFILHGASALMQVLGLGSY
eukprot:CAMPEP_0176028200 /NCGR_PEP_ID=MMETSP0120_2-20121206/13838_1 /TAXON_ID=160619 /ORGANISM="Kryptoperidinium foliaceum, Strain CCMP 1326" /LENGTH=351 /DNA_ID=CAMNT_0017361409 /DNA_START=165 /DNA_END=1220 /DNA_ORIENTATION=-